MRKGVKSRKNPERSQDQAPSRSSEGHQQGVQGNSSNDLYKFGFFFVTGVLVTILLYPSISQTFVSTREAAREPAATTAQSPWKQENVSMLPEEDEVNENVQILDLSEDDQDGQTEQFTSTEEISANAEEINSHRAEEESKSQENIKEEASKEVKFSNMADKASGKTAGKTTGESTGTASEKKKGKKAKKESEQKKPIKFTKTVEVNDQGKAGEMADQTQLPKEVRDFKPTTLKGVTAKKIFADGRRIPPMELLPQKPNNSSVKVWLFEEFLSEAECDGLMRAHHKHVGEQSKQDPILCFDSVSTLRKHLRNVGKKTHVSPRDFTAGTTCVNASFSSTLKEWFRGNWSYSTAFYPGESRFTSVFEHRVKEATGLLPENGGKFQITSYPEGIGYKTHTDCVEDNEDKRDRVATILIYLQTVEEGGETEFPELGIWVKPRKARALVWNNMNEDGKCEPLSIHKAAKVEKGHKIILQRWYYYKSFYSLGKRPQDPPLPSRSPGQPRVSCDEYENGSCRWYDEWNYEHIIEYERQKYTLI